MAYLEIQDLRVEYVRGVPTLDHFHLSIDEGELVALLGPSGCGKTTTLRSVAGFIEPAAGEIRVNDKNYTELAPNRRDIGMVFQSYALFPHLSVFDNVAFGLKMRRIARKDIDKRVREALALVDLDAFADRRPENLSGGQRQRVALARAIVIEPSLLLFDEPLSNLDAKLRVGMRTEIRRLQQRLGITALYVTHDQIEALAISDRIVVMNDGQIEQIGTPEAIYTHPQTAFVADFMGFANCFHASIIAQQQQTLTIQAGEHQLSVQAATPPSSEAIRVFFRPESARLHGDATDNCLPGQILMHSFQGQFVEYLIASDVGEFAVHMPQDAPLFDPGDIYIQLNPEKMVIIYE